MLSKIVPHGFSMGQPVLAKDARKNQRKGLHYTGQIVVDESAELGSAVNCLVENVSEGGARLTVKTEQIPDKFDLMLAPAVRRQCVVIWRSSQYLGVRFVHSESDTQK